MTPTETVEQNPATTSTATENNGAPEEQNAASSTDQDTAHDAAQNTPQTTGETHVHADGSVHPGPAHLHPAQTGFHPELVREVTVTADADSVDKAFYRVLKNYRRLARIPGFRVGKVPDSVIKNRFAKEVRQEVLDSLVSERFRQTMQEQGLQPVSQPQVTGLMLAEGQPLEFKAAFEVMPVIDITGYEDASVARPDVELTEAEYKGELDRALEPHATVETIEEDRPLVDGDWAEIEFKGVFQGDVPPSIGPDGQPDDEGTAENPILGEDVLIEVGGANTLPAFTESLRGATVGQQMDFEVTYPENFGEPRLAGKTVKYDLTVKAIKRKSYPERDAEFAKQFGNYDSWEAFETNLREMAGARKKQTLENAAKDQLLGELIQRFPFPVPETFVQAQIDARLDRGLRGLAQQGMTREQMEQLDFGRLRMAQRDEAVAEVKASLLLDRLAADLGITVPDEDVQREVLIASMQMREPFETVQERFNQDGTAGRIREQLGREKTGTALFEKLAK